MTSPSTAPPPPPVEGPGLARSELRIGTRLRGPDGQAIFRGVWTVTKITPRGLGDRCLVGMRHEDGRDVELPARWPDDFLLWTVEEHPPAAGPLALAVRAVLAPLARDLDLKEVFRATHPGQRPGPVQVPFDVLAGLRAALAAEEELAKLRRLAARLVRADDVPGEPFMPSSDTMRALRRWAGYELGSAP